MKTKRQEDPSEKQAKQAEEATGGGAGDFLRRNGSLFLLALVAAAAAFYIARYRTSTAADQLAGTRQSLAAAADGVQQLRSLEGLVGRITPEQYASQRDQLAGGVKTAVENVLKETKDADESDAPARSAALSARADANWSMANLPVPPEATTREILRPASTDKQYLDEAKGDWDLILKQYPKQSAAVADARFGLAAVAEERGEFDAAKKQYEAIAADAGSVPMHKEEAERRLKLLPELKTPVRLGTPATQPSTVPAATTPARITVRRPTTRSASRPTTVP